MSGSIQKQESGDTNKIPTQQNFTQTLRSQFVKTGYITKVMGYLRLLELSFKKIKSACLGKTKQTKTNNQQPLSPEENIPKCEQQQ